ncbi:MAG: biopolymer transporter ExbD [Flavobacteriales bacterium]|nr:biopolymer transporter ExbD [Flavobacteriales bacterium]
MAEIVGNEGGGGRHQKKRAKKGRVHLDMTPMVDLAFLLITFFILATTLSKPSVMEITYPKEKDVENEEKTKVADELATTILLGKKREHIYYYHGRYKPDTTVLEKTDFSKNGIRKLFLEKNREILEKIKAEEKNYQENKITEDEFLKRRRNIKGDDNAPFVIVKTLDKTPYSSVIDVVDELNIASIGKFAIQDMAETEDIALRQTTAEPE